MIQIKKLTPFAISSLRIEEKRIQLELMRFDYGYRVMEFIFNYTKLRLAYDRDEHDIVNVLHDVLETMRSELTCITEPLDEMKYECPWYENAYRATWHADGYDGLRKERGHECD